MNNNPNYKWHVNPETGEAGRCRAKWLECPFGDENHSDTESGVKRIYENNMRFMSLPSPISKRRSRTRTVKLDNKKMFPLYAAMKHRDPRTYTVNEVAELSRGRAVRCVNCDKPLGGEHAGLIAVAMQACDYRVKCSHCGLTVTSTDEPEIDLNTESPTYAAVEASNVSKMTWYHSTNIEDWDEAIFTEDGPEYIHLGGEAAAADRAATLEYYTGGTNKRYIYILEVDETAKVDTSIFDDDSADFRPPDYDEEDEENQFDTIRYKNRYEDVGSISLAIKPSKVRIIGKALVTTEDAYRMGTFRWGVPEGFGMNHASAA